MRNNILNRRTIVLSSITAVILILAFILFNSGAESSREDSMSKELVEIFTKTVYYLNKTKNDLRDAYNGLENTSYYVGDIDSLIHEYKRFEKKYLAYQMFPNQQSSLMKKLWSAYINYYRLTNSSRWNAVSAYKLSQVISAIKRSVLDLVQCNVNESLNTYYSIRDNVSEIVSYLKKSYNYLSEVRDEDLLNLQHVDLRNETSNTVKDIIEGLEKYLSIMDSVSRNATLYSEICYYAWNTELINETTRPSIVDYLNKTGGLKMIYRILDKLVNPQMGYATPESTSLKILLLNLLDRLKLEIPISFQSMNTTTPGGYGAGYYSYTETD